MNTNPAAKNVRGVEDVSSRVKNTKREIEQLKNELEQLFNVGAQLNPNRDKKVPEKILSLSPIPKEHATDRQKPQAPVTQKMEATKISPSKKNKNYNPADAREYIKKQKEKRAEQLRAQINVANTKVFIKKDKLRELHERARELVSKNVQLKRERSKSREPPPVRLDKTSPRYKSAGNIKKTNCSKSQERQRQVSATRVKSASRDGLKATEKPLRERNGQPQPNERSRSRTRNKPAETATSAQNIVTDYLHPPQETTHLQIEQSHRIKNPLTHIRNKPTSAQMDYLRPPEIEFHDKHLQFSVNTPEKNDGSLKHQQQIAPKEKKSSRNKPETITEKPKSMLELAIMTDACVKDTKETQTSRTNNFNEVPWMQPPKVLPYPYNFISTVKRKLQHAINSPISCVDLHSDTVNQTPEVEKVKSKEEIKEMLIQSAKSDLKSFASHKGPNLDLKQIENLELISKYNSKSNKDAASRKLVYESDSDTSKNIPDISSESLSVNSKPNLSLSKVKDMKLKSETKSNGCSESDNYSSDFQKESINNDNSDSIRTIFSDKKPSDPVPSDKTLTSHVNTDPTKSSKSKIQAVSDYFNNNSKKQSSDNHVNPETESLNLKEPAVSLTVRTDEKNSSDKNRESFLVTAIRNTAKLLASRGSRDHSEATLKTVLTGSETSKNATDSAPESLKGKSTKSSGKGGSSNLKTPSASLVGSRQKRNDLVKSQMKNITVRHAAPTNNINEIHLKFEAEVSLLNDFNESFRQFMAAEKAFENLKSKNETNLSTIKILQNVDTQTSVITRTSTNVSTERTKSRNSTINFSRGSEMTEDLNSAFLSNSTVTDKSLPNISFSNDWNLSKLNDSSIDVSVDEGRKSEISLANIENFDVKNCNNIVSLNIFDQLIKDEDSRIQQLKLIIKIREQALLDRTKTELVWLEVQRKHLKETGKIQEASLLRKKQRGILIKHEQERNEIKKLKQMQKEVSEHRKNTLKQQRNLVKTQLSTNNMLSKITVKKREERRSVGPLRVVQSCSESVHSETSTSLKSSGVEDILNGTLKQARVSESSELDISKGDVDVSNAKRTLLMREAALQKRRKAAEELLRWHRKLLDEERKISELEATATSVVKQASESDKEKRKLKGKQLQQLWKNINGSDDKKFDEDKVYAMSQIALERFCESARQYSNKNKKTKSSELNENSGEKSVKKSSDDVIYSSGFEPESVQEIINSPGEKTQISSISELIDNFSRIEDEISTLSKKSEDIVAAKEELDRSSKTVELSMAPDHVAEEDNYEENFSERTSDVEDVTKSEHSVITAEADEKSEQAVINGLLSQEAEVPSAKYNDINTEEDQEDEEVNFDDVPSRKEHLDRSIKDDSTIEDEKLTDIRTDYKEKFSYDSSTTLEEINEIFMKEDFIEQPTELTFIKSRDEQEIEEEKSMLEPSSLESKHREESPVPLASIREVTESVTEQISREDAKTADTIEGPDKNSIENQSISSRSVITNESAAISIKDTKKDLLELDEALESASKIEESLTKLNKQLSSVTLEETVPIATEEEESHSKVSTTETSSTESEPKTPKKDQIDVKKRVSEILADASLSRGDKSPRLQDLYVTAYDVGASNSSELNDEEGRQLPTDIFGSEAEELWKKQLAIEQEIKQLELQQKVEIPYVFMREIPNKPPPPYTPPSSSSSLPQTILPSDVKEINEVASYSSKVLYKAYQNNNLDKVKFSEHAFKLFSNVEVAKGCAEFMFNVCRDIVRDHYKQFETVEEPSWLSLAKKPQLVRLKPADASNLEKMLNQKLKELFGFKKVQIAESAIIKWGRKKRDHVDEVLVAELLEEDSEWTNFEKDELTVKNQLTEDIMKMLLEETSTEFVKILSKKKTVVG